MPSFSEFGFPIPDGFDVVSGFSRLSPLRARCSFRYVPNSIGHESPSCKGREGIESFPIPDSRLQPSPDSPLPILPTGDFR